MTMRARAAVLPLPLLTGACTYQHYQSIYGNAAAETQQFNTLFIVFLVVCAVMYLAVIAFLIAGLARRRRSTQANIVEDGRHHESDPAMHTGLKAWAAVVGVGLIGLAIASFFADRSMASAAAKEKLSIDLTGNQWWWNIEYNSADASKTLRTANELYLPVGVPVRINLHSNDVIHSFWVPSLAGKQDLIPGRDTDITVVPKTTGMFRGQCAEFCGTQHAHMALVVNVVSYADFIKWWDHQLQPAPVPVTSLTQAGYKYVTGGPCSACHAIGGSPSSACRATRGSWRWRTGRRCSRCCSTCSPTR